MITRQHQHDDSATSDHRIKLNIGGKHFETTTTTLQSTFISTASQPLFYDRNPDTFSSLLSLLRTRHPPRKYHHLKLLTQESQFYGINLSPFLSPPQFSPVDASYLTSLIPSCSPFVSASSSSSMSLLLAHRGVLTWYDPITLSLESTVRTHVDDVSCVLPISPDVSAVGSGDCSGVHFYSGGGGGGSVRGHVGSLFWVDESDTRVQKSRVTALADSAGDESYDSGLSVFSAAFECKHGENAVLIVDRSTLKVVSEIGRQSGNSTKSAAIKRMRWVPRAGLLVGSTVNCGAFGYSGYVRVWDPRSGEMVWETSEPGGVVRNSRLGDTMADVDVDPEGLYLAKVGSKSGDLGVADLRKLSPDPWVYLEDPNPGFSGNWKSGCSVVVHCYKGHMLVGRDGELEAWSRVGDREVLGDVADGDRNWGVYRRNFVDKVEDSERGIIRKIEGGGNRLFISRDNAEGIEVWETSPSSGAKSVL